MRKFVATLDGPPCTYCSCSKLCSKSTVDHVVPVSYLQTRIGSRAVRQRAINDPHNLYRCCSKLNGEKGARLLSEADNENPHSGLMARSYMYMNWRYQLDLDEYLLSTIKSLSLYQGPTMFERHRARLVYHYTGQSNPFIEYFPLTIAQRVH